MVYFIDDGNEVDEYTDKAAWMESLRQRCIADPTEDARLWMLTVVACDEQLGDDSMCECARAHFDAIRQARVDELLAARNLTHDPDFRQALSDRAEQVRKGER